MIIVVVLLIFSLNWILQIPAKTPIIGDEKTWLPIIISIIIFISKCVLDLIEKRNNDKEEQIIIEEQHKRQIIKESLKIQIRNKTESYYKLEKIIESNLIILDFNNSYKSLLLEYNHNFPN